MGWITTYFGPRNIPKACVVLLAGLLLSACADGDRGVDLGTLDDRYAAYETAYLGPLVGRDSHNEAQHARRRAYQVFLERFCRVVPVAVEAEPAATSPVR